MGDLGLDNIGKRLRNFVDDLKTTDSRIRVLENRVSVGTDPAIDSASLSSVLGPRTIFSAKVVTTDALTYTFTALVYRPTDGFCSGYLEPDPNFNGDTITVHVATPENLPRPNEFVNVLVAGLSSGGSAYALLDRTGVLAVSSVWWAVPPIRTFDLEFGCCFEVTQKWYDLVEVRTGPDFRNVSNDIEGFSFEQLYFVSIDQGMTITDNHLCWSAYSIDANVCLVFKNIVSWRTHFGVCCGVTRSSSSYGSNGSDSMNSSSSGCSGGCDSCDPNGCDPSECDACDVGYCDPGGCDPFGCDMGQCDACDPAVACDVCDPNVVGQCDPCDTGNPCDITPSCDAAGGACDNGVCETCDTVLCDYPPCDPGACDGAICGDNSCDPGCDPGACDNNPACDADDPCGNGGLCDACDPNAAPCEVVICDPGPCDTGFDCDACDGSGGGPCDPNLASDAPCQNVPADECTTCDLVCDTTGGMCDVTPACDQCDLGNGGCDFNPNCDGCDPAVACDGAGGCDHINGDCQECVNDDPNCQIGDPCMGNDAA